MLVSVLPASLLKVTSVVNAHDAILLAFLDWGDTYHNQVVIVQQNFVHKYCGPVLLS